MRSTAYQCCCRTKIKASIDECVAAILVKMRHVFIDFDGCVMRLIANYSCWEMGTIRRP